jgi:hypothetical protein
MTNLRTDRVPDRTLPQASASEVKAGAPATRPGSVRAFVLAVRLFASDGNAAPTGVSWNSAGSMATLALDLIKSSGGTRDAGGDAVVTAGFPNLQSALLTARRLQWALEGMGGEHENAAATILVHSAEDPSAASAQAALEKASPGRILLGSSVAESVYQLPNIMLRDASGPGGWREMLWRSTVPANLAADEQSVLRQIRELGREDPCPAELPAPAPKAVTARVAVDFPAAAAPQDDLLGPTRREPSPAPETPGTKKWLIVGGAAAAVIVFAAVLIPFLVSANHAKPVAPPPETKTHTPDTPPVTVPTPAPAPVPTPAPPKAPIDKTSHPSGVKPTNSDQPGDVRPAGSKGYGKCELIPSEIPKTLDRAEYLLHAGQLEEAQAAFESVQNCPGAYQRAQAGLKLVKQRIATQGYSSGP